MTKQPDGLFIWSSIFRVLFGELFSDSQQSNAFSDRHRGGSSTQYNGYSLWYYTGPEWLKTSVQKLVFPKNACYFYPMFFPISTDTCPITSSLKYRYFVVPTQKKEQRGLFPIPYLHNPHPILSQAGFVPPLFSLMLHEISRQSRAKMLPYSIVSILKTKLKERETEERKLTGSLRSTGDVSRASGSGAGTAMASAAVAKTMRLMSCIFTVAIDFSKA